MSLSQLFYNVALVAFTAGLMWVINVAQECRWDMLNTAVTAIDNVADTIWAQVRDHGVSLGLVVATGGAAAAAKPVRAAAKAAGGLAAGHTKAD